MRLHNRPGKASWHYVLDLMLTGRLANLFAIHKPAFAIFNWISCMNLRRRRMTQYDPGGEATMKPVVLYSPHCSSRESSDTCFLLVGKNGFGLNERTPVLHSYRWTRENLNVCSCYSSANRRWNSAMQHLGTRSLKCDDWF